MCPRRSPTGIGARQKSCSAATGMGGRLGRDITVEERGVHDDSLLSLRVFEHIIGHSVRSCHVLCGGRRKCKWSPRDVFVY
jgi:hypothetical protein